MAETTMKYAVVTGANRGIGFEVCRQLLSQGITVVLTARDEKRGLEAVEKLNKLSYNNNGGVVIFHQLQVTDLASSASLAEFIKSQFGKLDILVNNAGSLGGIVQDEVRKALEAEGAKEIDWNGFELTETYDLAAECIQTNYYGAKTTTEALLPLLQLSESPTIVNVSSSVAKLKYLQSHEWAKGILNDAENLTEDKIDEVLNVFLKDFKDETLEAKGWPLHNSAYVVSKAALNAYTRFLAKKYPGIRINCVCPGYVKTESSFNTGLLTVEEGSESLVRLALFPPSHDGPSGLFFRGKLEVTSFDEDD